MHPVLRQPGTTGQRIYFTRRNERDDEQNPGERPVIIVIDDTVLRAFVIRVYIYAIIFLAFSSVVWLVISATSFNFSEAVPVSTFIWLSLAFTALLVMNCFPMIRHKYPCNLIMAFVIVVLVTLAFAGYMHLFSVLLVLLGLVIAFLIMVLLHAYGAMCPKVLLPGIMCAGCLLCLLLIGMIVFGIITFFVKNRIYGLVFVILLFLAILLITPLQAEYMHGRLDMVPLFDMMSCSLTFYVHFVMLFYCIGFLFVYASDNKSSD